MRLKKTIVLITLSMFCISNMQVILADDYNEELNPDFIYEEIIDTSSESVDEPKIISKSAVIFDRDSKEALFGKQEDLRVPMASTTKIMTAIILLENGDLNQTITVDKIAATTGGSRLGLQINDKITLNDLLYGLMICSRE